MHTISFFFKRLFIFLADLVIVPSQWLISAWRMPGRGRAAIFALPTCMMGIALFVSVLAGMLGVNAQLQKRYQGLAAQAELDARVAVEADDKELAIKHLNIAEAFWTKLREYDPNNNDYLFGLFSVAMQKAIHTRTEGQPLNFGGASEIFKRLAPNDRPVHLKSHLLRAELILSDPRTRSSITNLEMAEQQLSLALRLDANNEEAKLRLADIYYARGNKDDAFKIYEAYYRKYPVFIFKMYTILSDNNELDRVDPYLTVAINSYEKTLEEYPDDTSLWERYIRCFLLQKRFEHAETLLIEKQNSLETPEQKLEFDKLLAQLYSLWAITLGENIDASSDVDQEKMDAYMDLLRKGLAKDEKNARLLQLITLVGNSKYSQAAEARQIYDPRVDPENANAADLLAVGTYELLEGDYAFGIELLEIALKRNPDNPIIANNLSFAIRNTDGKRALELIDNALRIAPRNANLLDTRGHVYIALGDYYKAISNLTAAEENGKRNDIQLNQALARCYRQVGLTAEAEIREATVERLQSERPVSTPPSDSKSDEPEATNAAPLDSDNTNTTIDQPGKPSDEKADDDR